MRGGTHGSDSLEGTITGADMPLLLIESARESRSFSSFFSEFEKEKEREERERVRVAAGVGAARPGGARGAECGESIVGVGSEALLLKHGYSAIGIRGVRGDGGPPKSRLPCGLESERLRKLRNKAFFGFSVSTSKKLPHGSPFCMVDVVVAVIAVIEECAFDSDFRH